MKHVLGLPRSVAILLLAIGVFTIFLVMAYFLFAPSNQSGSPVVSASEPATQAAATTPGAIDLLKLVDPAQDTIHGTWTRDGSTLVNSAAGQAQFEIPYVPPAEYDFHLTLLCDQNTAVFAAVCFAGDKQFVWRVTAGGLSGFALVDGKGFGGNDSTKDGVSWLHPGQPVTLSFKFRRDHVDILIDDQPLTSFQTDYQNFSLNPMYQQHYPDTLGVFTNGPLTVQSAKIVEITGTGKPSR